MATAVNAPVERPPGPELGPLEVARMLRSRRMTDFLQRAAERGPTLSHFRIGGDDAYLVGTPELVRRTRSCRRR